MQKMSSPPPSVSYCSVVCVLLYFLLFPVPLLLFFLLSPQPENANKAIKALVIIVVPQKEKERGESTTVQYIGSSRKTSEVESKFKFPAHHSVRSLCLSSSCFIPWKPTLDSVHVLHLLLLLLRVPLQHQERESPSHVEKGGGGRRQESLCVPCVCTVYIAKKAHKMWAEMRELHKP